MKSTQVCGISIYFDPEEREAADKLIIGCEQSIENIRSSWGLPVPGDCRVYLLTSWPRCVYLGAPLGSQVLLTLTMPFWYRDFKARWMYAGGWSQRYGQRQVVGIKAPRLIAGVVDAYGEKIFIREDDLYLKMLSVLCHELTHAFSAHLSLPAWLIEGLAMVTVDRCLGKITVRPDSLDLLGEPIQPHTPKDRINMQAQSREEIILLYIRGYWLTRFLADTQAELLNKALTTSMSASSLEETTAAALGIPPDLFWQKVEPLLVNHYR